MLVRSIPTNEIGKWGQRNKTPVALLIDDKLQAAFVFPSPLDRCLVLQCGGIRRGLRSNYECLCLLQKKMRWKQTKDNLIGLETTLSCFRLFAFREDNPSFSAQLGQVQKTRVQTPIYSLSQRGLFFFFLLAMLFWYYEHVGAIPTEMQYKRRGAVCRRPTRFSKPTHKKCPN